MSKKILLGTAFGLALSAAAAQAAPITTPPQTLSAIGDVTAVYIFADAGDTSTLDEMLPASFLQIFCNHDTGGCIAATPGQTAALGNQNGAMQFRLNNLTQGTNYLSDTADSDGNYHVLITDDYSDFNVGALPGAAALALASLSGSITFVGWEDRNADQASDFDYNDLIFAFANTTTRQVPEPFTLSLMGVGVAGAAWAKRRKNKKA